MLRGIVVFLALLGAAPALGHESLPIVISLEEKATGAYLVRLRLPPAVSSRVPPQIEMPSGCERVARRADGGKTRVNSGTIYRCDAALDGKAIDWAFSGSVPAIPTFVRFHWLTGERRTVLAPPGSTHVIVPARESAGSVSRQYLGLGIDHILKGYDHLLFLACLLWAAGGVKRIVLTVTGFTLAHSVTLALSALSLVRLPLPPVEAAIALSILFLAREIAAGRRGSLIWKHPVLISSLFGLLHGFGFAAALKDVGLPQTQLLPGLLFFNIGVEVGQLAVILTILGVLAFLRSWLAKAHMTASPPGQTPLVERISRLAPYLIGGIAAFWLVERVAGFF